MDLVVVLLKRDRCIAYHQSQSSRLEISPFFKRGCVSPNQSLPLSDEVCDGHLLLPGFLSCLGQLCPLTKGPMSLGWRTGGPASDVSPSVEAELRPVCDQILLEFLSNVECEPIFACFHIQ